MNELEGMFYVLADEFLLYELQCINGIFRLTIEADKVIQGDDLKKVLSEAIEWAQNNQ